MALMKFRTVDGVDVEIDGDPNELAVLHLRLMAKSPTPQVHPSATYASGALQNLLDERGRLRDENSSLREDNEDLADTVQTLEGRLADYKKTVEALRIQAATAQENWTKAKDANAEAANRFSRMCKKFREARDKDDPRYMDTLLVQVVDHFARNPGLETRSPILAAIFNVPVPQMNSMLGWLKHLKLLDRKINSHDKDDNDARKWTYFLHEEFAPKSSHK
jgi:flagellar biosynthesis chaperone FliJ